MSTDTKPPIASYLGKPHIPPSPKNATQKKLEKLNQIANSTQKVLIEIKSVFPFTLFPDRVKVDVNKVDIIQGVFFFSNHVFTILIKDLVSTKVSTGMLFASLEFEVRGYEKNPEPITFLPRSQAIKVRDLIMGLIASKKEGIDISNVPKKELRKQLLQIGSSHTNLSQSGFGYS